MPQSLSRVLVHVIFSTKGRAALLRPESVQGDMNSYLAGMLARIGCPAVLVGCVEDHVHVLCVLSRNLSVSQLIGKLKAGSSKWAKTRGLKTFQWQNGYAAFSVSPSNAPGVERYIATQSEHHRRMTFQDELRRFLAAHGVEYDERYVWD